VLRQIRVRRVIHKLNQQRRHRGGC
jgi:hypothetical protein